jgi:hypothetical protein
MPQKSELHEGRGRRLKWNENHLCLEKRIENLIAKTCGGMGTSVTV